MVGGGVASFYEFIPFKSEILKRPKNEKPYLLIPVGYPADDAMVPNIRKKSFEEIAEII